MENNITIIDYGYGNLHSIQSAFNKLKISTIITKKNAEIENSKIIILPGLVHFIKP